MRELMDRVKERKLGYTTTTAIHTRLQNNIAWNFSISKQRKFLAKKKRALLMHA